MYPHIHAGICVCVCVCVLTPNRPKSLINFAARQCAFVMATRKDLRGCPQPAGNVGRTTRSLPGQACNIIHSSSSRKRNISFTLCVSTATIHLTEKGKEAASFMKFDVIILQQTNFSFLLCKLQTSKTKYNLIMCLTGINRQWMLIRVATHC